MPTIYLDHISATPLLPQGLEAMLPYLKECFGNPSSLHGPAVVAREAIEAARVQAATLIGASAREIVFTASATEANNLALRGVASALQKRGNHIVTSSVEHVSVLGPLDVLEKEGFEVTRLPVDSMGRVDPGAVASSFKKTTILLSIQHANPEVGTVQSLEQIAAVTKPRGVLFHADATATAGVLPIDVERLGVDLLTFSAQSVYGPKGAAALYVRRGTRLHPILQGGGQEGGRRPGTENVPAIVGFGVAADIAREEREERTAHLARLGGVLMEGMIARVSGFMPTGSRNDRLPGHVSGCIEGAEGEALTVLLRDEGIIATTDTACASGNLRGSHVLTAMGIDPALARTSIVMTVGRGTSDADVEEVLERMPVLVQRLRDALPVGPA